MPRKHLIASKTNAKQQSQAKIWLKLAKEIKAAAKVGGTNPDANPRLKAAINKALQNNLSRESIDRNIKGSEKDQDNLQVVEFECYGPNGIQIIVKGLTDNINRTASALRGYLSKLGGEIGKTNSVKMFFNEYGVFIVEKTANISEDSLMDLTMNFDIVDIIENEDCFEILCNTKCFYEAKEELEKNNVKIFESDIKLVPDSSVTIIDDEVQRKLDRFIASCDDDDDIQNVVTNT